MKKVINWLKNIRPLKIATVFVLGFFLLFTQSCSSKGIATQPPQQKAESAYIERYDPTKEYPLNAPKGGMNNFSDVDPRGEFGKKQPKLKLKLCETMLRETLMKKALTAQSNMLAIIAKAHLLEKE